MMGQTVANNICGNKTKYNPGIWFNSAKFFDIEYQTYGVILPKPPEGQLSFEWENKSQRVRVRINFEKESGKFVGINLFGIRGRHHIYEKWLSEGKNIKYVVENLKLANFDPEFFKSYEADIIQAFNQKHNTNFTLKAKKGIFRRSV